MQVTSDDIKASLRQALEAETYFNIRVDVLLWSTASNTERGEDKAVSDQQANGAVARTTKTTFVPNFKIFVSPMQVSKSVNSTGITYLSGIHCGN